MFKIPSARVKLHTKGQVFTSGEKSVQLLEMIHRALPGPSQMFYMAIIETHFPYNFSKPLQILSFEMIVLKLFHDTKLQMK